MTRQLLEVGDRPRTTWSVKLDGALVDPPKILLIVMQPASPSPMQLISQFGLQDQPYTIVKETVGVYYADLPLIVHGTWVRRWVALDENEVPLTASETEFVVRQSATTNPLGIQP